MNTVHIEQFIAYCIIHVSFTYKQQDLRLGNERERLWSISNLYWGLKSQKLPLIAKPWLTYLLLGP